MRATEVIQPSINLMLGRPQGPGEIEALAIDALKDEAKGLAATRSAQRADP
jgi:hypothetical protein